MDDTRIDTGELRVMLTADIAAAHLSHNAVAIAEAPALVSAVHAALAGLVPTPRAAEQPPAPAVSIRASVKRDYLVCIEDGRKMKVLKRHLMNEHGMTPSQYRERWGPSADYPMVAPGHAEARRDLAVKSGLGRDPNQRGGRRKLAR